MGDESGSGRPRETTTEEVFEALSEIDTPVATGTELAQLLNVSQQTVLRRLDELRANGRVERKEVGAQAVVWWPSEES